MFAQLIFVFLMGHIIMSHSASISEPFDIDFMDCGSENINIDSIYIEGCRRFPCYLQRGQSYDIVITPDHLDPQIDTVDLDVKANIRGALFDINAKFTEPCGLPCPINARVVLPHIPITLEPNPALLRGPAPLIINAFYRNGAVRRAQLCVEFNVYIW